MPAVGCSGVGVAAAGWAGVAAGAGVASGGNSVTTLPDGTFALALACAMDMCIDMPTAQCPLVQSAPHQRIGIRRRHSDVYGLSSHPHHSCANQNVACRAKACSVSARTNGRWQHFGDFRLSQAFWPDCHRQLKMFACHVKGLASAVVTAADFLSADILFHRDLGYLVLQASRSHADGGHPI